MSYLVTGGLFCSLEIKTLDFCLETVKMSCMCIRQESVKIDRDR